MVEKRNRIQVLKGLSETLGSAVVKFAISSGNTTYAPHLKNDTLYVCMPILHACWVHVEHIVLQCDVNPRVSPGLWRPPRSPTRPPIPYHVTLNSISRDPDALEPRPTQSGRRSSRQGSRSARESEASPGPKGEETGARALLFETRRRKRMARTRERRASRGSWTRAIEEDRPSGPGAFAIEATSELLVGERAERGRTES